MAHIGYDGQPVVMQAVLADKKKQVGPKAALLTRLPIVTFLECCDGLVVPAGARQVKDPDGLVVPRPYVAPLPVEGHAVRSCDLVCCVVGTIHTPQIARTRIPEMYGVGLQRLNPNMVDKILMRFAILYTFCKQHQSRPRYECYTADEQITGMAQQMLQAVSSIMCRMMSACVLLWLVRCTERVINISSTSSVY